MRTSHALFAAVCLLIFAACKKEKIIIKEVPIRHSWSMDSSITGLNKLLLTSLPLNDSVLAVASHSAIWYVNANHVNESINGAYLTVDLNYGNLIPPSLTKTIGVNVYDPNELQVFATMSPGYNMGSFRFFPTYTTGNSLKGLPTPFFPQSGYPIINSKYILAPTELDYIQQKAYCSLIEVNYSSTPYPNQLSFVSSKTITLTPAPSTRFYAGGYFSAAYHNKFFLSLNNQFYRIDTLGNVKTFGEAPAPQQGWETVYQMFESGNKLFAVSGRKFFVSEDTGENWTMFFDAAGTQYTWATYFNVGNELYATIQSQIWRVTLSGNKLEFKELDNDGLQTNRITSVSKAGKYAFVTTLAGLYYRDTASFNTPRK